MANFDNLAFLNKMSRMKERMSGEWLTYSFGNDIFDHSTYKSFKESVCIQFDVIGFIASGVFACLQAKVRVISFILALIMHTNNALKGNI